MYVWGAPDGARKSLCTSSSLPSFFSRSRRRTWCPMTDLVPGGCVHCSALDRPLLGPPVGTGVRGACHAPRHRPEYKVRTCVHLLHSRGACLLRARIRTAGTGGAIQQVPHRTARRHRRTPPSVVGTTSRHLVDRGRPPFICSLLAAAAAALAMGTVTGRHPS